MIHLEEVSPDNRRLDLHVRNDQKRLKPKTTEPIGKNTYTIYKQINAGTHFSGINDVAALSE